MKEIERIKTFKFKGEDYKVEVPTVGQYLDIENEKLINSDGHWTDLIRSQTVSALRSIQIIECISVLKVLCPDLFNNMKVTSYKDIDVMDFVELLSIYNNIINPWYSAWFKNFNEIIILANQAAEANKENEE